MRAEVHDYIQNIKEWKNSKCWLVLVLIVKLWFSVLLNLEVTYYHSSKGNKWLSQLSHLLNHLSCSLPPCHHVTASVIWLTHCHHISQSFDLPSVVTLLIKKPMLGYRVPQIHNLFFGLDSNSLKVEMIMITAEDYFCVFFWYFITLFMVKWYHWGRSVLLQILLCISLCYASNS